MIRQTDRYASLLVILGSILLLTSCVRLQQTPLQKKTLRKVGNTYYGFRNSDGTSYPIIVVGGDDSTFFPKPAKQYTPELQTYDVIIVGGGLSGLVSALYLTDHNKKVLVLQKENYLGGLAAYREDRRGFTYDRGASYWTKAFNQQFQIMKHIGISRYFSEYIIPEPVDSYFWKGILYGSHPHEGLWDDRALGLQVPAKYKNGTSLPVLPSAFAIFKLELIWSNKAQLVPDQPFEKAKKSYLDTLTATEWIRKMPLSFYRRITKSNGPFAKEKRLWARFQHQIQSGLINGNDPMIDVIQFLELYCRSALGSIPDDLSAMGFANFYTSEIEPRFTTPFGSGFAAKLLTEHLIKIPHLATLKAGSPVIKLRNTATGVQVDFIEDGIAKSATAKKGVYAAQIPMAPNIVEDLQLKSPEQAKLMRAIKFAHYSVHNVEITNHPYRAAYDTWTRSADYTRRDFTDLITGRWVQMKGYREKDYSWNYDSMPDNKGSIFSIYHPLHNIDSSAVTKTNNNFTDQYAAEVAEYAFNRLDLIYKDAFKQKFKINQLVTNRWPYSIHVPGKYYFTVTSRKISKSFGNIVFGNSVFGTPSFEEALYRGHCSANKALIRLDPKFVQESWSKCELNL